MRRRWHGLGSPTNDDRRRILVVTPKNWTSGEVKARTGILEPRRGFAMTQRRTFTAEFKTQVVLILVSGARRPAELCR